jgi:ABC-type dipeptide/oligopeptide/nickel transport system permease subunit
MAKKTPSFISRIIKDKTTILGFIFICFVFFLAIFAPFLAPSDPYEQKMVDRFSEPNAKNLLGTDKYGRDVLSRMIYGSRISLFVGFTSVLIGGVFGGSLGLIAGYHRGRIDVAISWLTDILMSFPSIILAIIVVVVFQAGTLNAAIAIGIVFVPRFLRLVRASAMAIATSDYIEASKAAGQSSTKIIIQHVTPNLLGELVVMSSLWIATAIRMEAILGFLGLGAQPPEPSWGVMIRDGLDYIFAAPWLSLFPGIGIFLAAIGFNIVGDFVRDMLDPKLQGTM